MDRCNKTGLTETDWKTILDVLNMYDPNDVAHVVPEMATPQFMLNLNRTFHAVLKHVERLKGPGMPTGGFPSNSLQDQQFLHDS